MPTLHPRLGDVVELPVPEGFTYLQVITGNLGSGVFAVRGFRGVHDVPAEDFDAIVHGDQLFALKYPLAGHNDGLTIVASVSFNGDTSHDRFIRRRNGLQLGIRHRPTGTEEIVERFLPRHYELPLDTYLTGERMLANMIRTEYRDSQAETGHELIGPKPVELIPKTPRPERKSREFFVYFSDEVTARTARRRIAALADVTETRATATDFGVVALTSRSVDAPRIEAKLRAIASALGGTYDGSGVNL